MKRGFTQNAPLRSPHPLEVLSEGGLAKENVRRVKEIFGNVIELNLLIKDYDGTENSHFNISEGELDRYLKDGYTENDLKMKLV